MKFLSILAFLVISTVSAFAADWSFIQDRLNDPVYSGPSGLEGNVVGDSIHIFGINTETPPGNNDPLRYWPGLSAESTTEFTGFTLEASASLNGSGSGYMYGITIWGDRSHYIMYGLDFDASVPYQPSKWTAYGGMPIPEIMPTWTILGGPINDPNGLHQVKVELAGGVARFWFDEVLLDTTSFSMPNAKLRLGAFARANGDTVDASYSSIVFTPVPEPATMAVFGLGLLAFIKRRRK